MKAIEIYEKETGNKQPSNQMAYHEWDIEYVSWLEQQVEKNSYTATVPYQCCPICNGKGEVVADGFTGAVYHKCTVCDGKKIIPEAIIPQEAL